MQSEITNLIFNNMEFNPQAFRDNLSETLNSVPDHDERKDLHDLVRESKAYKEARTWHKESIAAHNEYQTYLQMIEEWQSGSTSFKQMAKKIPEDMWKDRAFVLCLLENYTHDCPPIFKMADPSVRQDREVIASAAARHHDVLSNIPQKSAVLDDAEFLLSLCPILEKALNKGVYGDIVHERPSVYNIASKSLKNNKDFVLKVVSIDPGIEYSDIPKSLLKDPEIMKAIFDRSKSLEYVSAEMRADEETALEALKQHPDEFSRISNDLKHNIHFFERVLKENQSGAGGWGYSTRDNVTISFWEANHEAIGAKLDINKTVETFLGPRPIITEIKDLDLLARFIAKLDGGSLQFEMDFSSEEESKLRELLGEDFSYKFTELWRDGTWEKFTPNFMKERQIKYIVARLGKSLDKQQIETELRRLVQKYS